MEISPLKIGDLVLKVPIIQGGMGVGISRSKLASAVANMGGLGVIAGVQIGFEEDNFEKDNDQANIAGLIKEIRKAREMSPTGALAINMLAAANNYKDMVLAAVKEKIDVIISGAGLPLNLPSLVENSNTKIIPIVSSGKAARTISKSWDRKYNYLPDAIIVEGPKAGGHLGFSEETLVQGPLPKLENLVTEVIEAIKPFEEKYKRKIPVIAAGGVFDGSDIAKFLKLGASGVQMGTRFVATDECDADQRFKQSYVDAKKEDIQIVVSPLGMPGRAIRNKLIEMVEEKNTEIKKCYLCLKGCKPKTAPYCISKALIDSVRGNIEDGLLFCGENAHRIDKIVPVKDLIDELMTQTREALSK